MVKKNFYGFYKDIGVIELENDEKLEIPFGTSLKINIEFDEIDFNNGSSGFVWATHDKDQAETILSALQAQGINSEISQEKLEGTNLYYLKIPDVSRIESAIDFIWRSSEGLKLKPDWHYHAGKPNESFEKWTKNF
ncbi:MAG: hypothetical protein WAM24_07435 [Ignavibacteriaceae bacterium]